MFHGLTNRLEIDVTQLADIGRSFDIARKHKLPAVVVNQGIIQEALIARIGKQGGFKIIAPIDWPKGINQGMHKFRGISTHVLEADGFEIMMGSVGSKTTGQYVSEMKEMISFIRTHIGPMMEIRFVLPVINGSLDAIANACGAFKDIQGPAMVRLDHHTKVPVTKMNAEVHNNLIDKVREITKVPIKLSGNIDSFNDIASCNRANRMAVSVGQAERIIDDIIQKPEKIKRLFSPDEGLSGVELEDADNILDVKAVDNAT